MRLRVCLLALSLAALGSAASGQGAKPAPAVAFVDVAVVPMDRERVLERQTVVVRDGRIAEIGPAGKVKVPKGAQTIDGRGKFLMPGLAEMHGHLPHPAQGEELSRQFLRLFVANGVTTVRGMFGFPHHPELRGRIASGELFGPTLYVASPALSGQSVQSAGQARELVRQYKKEGFDLLKVHEGLSLEAYDAIAAEARAAGIPIGGHLPASVSLAHALAARQSSIEHLDGYVEALEADDSPLKGADPATRAQQLHNHLDERKIPALAAATREAGVWNSPTMKLWQAIYGPETVESLRRRPELRYVPAQMVEQWAKQKAGILQQVGPDPAPARRMLEVRDRVLKALAGAGARLLLGSDAPQLFSVPGFSIHREMEAMAAAGLTPYQILEAGTRNPAVYLGAPSEFGTVEVGRRADLILVDANPLADVRNAAKRSGVMLRGRWYPQSELDAMIAQSGAP